MIFMFAKPKFDKVNLDFHDLTQFLFFNLTLTLPLDTLSYVSSCAYGAPTSQPGYGATFGGCVNCIQIAYNMKQDISH